MIFKTQQATLPLFDNTLEKRLPAVRGRLAPNAPLRQFSWLNAGGPAEVLFRPADRADLIHFVQNCPQDIPITVLGVMSNVIIRDGGIPGVVVRLGRGFSDVIVKDHVVEAGSATMDMNIALFCADQGLGGLEFLSGIPGSLGGGLRMNAGAYGREIKDVLISTDVLFRNGEVRRMTAAEMGMSYRKNTLPDTVIFLSARLQSQPAAPEDIHAKILEIKTKRASTQPIKTKTGGSTFANPEGKKAWELIDAAGCRGLQIGGAQMSTMHCNFMINTGDATASDLEALGEDVRKRVFEKSGVMLEWEIKRIGIPRASSD